MKVDLKRIKQDIDLVDYIERVTGVNALKKGRTWFFNPCPACGGSDHFAVSLNSDTWLYQSFSKKKDKCDLKGGSIIDFVQEFEEVKGVKGAVEHLANQFGWIGTAATSETPVQAQPAPSTRKQQLEQEAKEVLPLPDMRAEFETLNSGTIIDEYNYFASRGISEDVQRKYLLGRHADGLNYFIRKYKEFNETKGDFAGAYKYFIPVVDPDGGIKYFLPYLDSESGIQVAKVHNLKNRGIRFFNDRYLQQPNTVKDYIFLTEGVFDALSLETIGYHAISINSTSNVKKLADMIKDNKPKYRDITFAIAFDNDESGQTATKKLIDRFKTDGINYDVFSFDKEHKDINDLLQADKARLIQDLEAFESQHEERELEQLHNASTLLEAFQSEVVKNINTKGIKTGFPVLDDKLGGGLYSGLYTLGAISSLGKTTLALQIADNIATSGQDVMFFSLEMSANEVIAKSLSRLSAGIAAEKGNKDLMYSTRRILNGDLEKNKKDDAETAATETKKQYKVMLEKYEAIQDNMFIIEGDFNADLAMIRNKVERHTRIRKTKPVVIVDYLQILLPESDRLTDKQAVDRNIVGLKRLSREFDIPVILVSSFNRENYANTVSYASFKESGAIEYSSDVILGLQLFAVHAAVEEKEKTAKENILNDAKNKIPREVELVILKNRNGKAFDRTLFDFYPQVNYFEHKEYSSVQKNVLGLN